MLYSPYKAAYHLDKIKALRDVENRYKVYPIHVQIDLTNKCNHNCLYCFYRHGNNKLIENFDEVAYLPYNKLKDLIKELQDLGIRALQLTGGGEPLLYYKIEELLDYLNKTNLELSLVTNGALLNEKIVDKISNYKWIRVSIDASNKDIYAKLRLVSPNQFNKVIKNLENAVKKLKNKVIIGSSFVINPINYRQIYDFGKLVKDIGVDNIRYSLAYTDFKNKLFMDIWNEIMEQMDKVLTLRTNDFVIFDLAKTHYGHLTHKKSYKVCGYSLFTTVVEANGDVRPCCTLKNSADKGSIFGNINEQSFSKIWTGDKRRKWLNNFDSKNCILCWMDSKNELINYLISNEEPPHINFV